MNPREKAIVGIIATIVVLAPLLLGGARPDVQVFLSGAALIACAVSVFGFKHKTGPRRTLFLTVAAVALGGTLLQLVPLPLFMARALSPQAAELRSEVGRAAFIPLTLDVPATVLEVVKEFACLGLIIVVASFAYSGRRARAILRAIVGAGVLVLVIAVVQKLLHSEHVLGFHRPRSAPGSGIWGTFVDGNHAASLWSLSALIAAGLAVDLNGLQRKIFGVAAVACAAAVVWTGSRAGAAGLGVGAVLLTGVLLSRRLGPARAIGATLAGTVLVGALAIALGDELRTRLLSDQRNAEGLFDNQKTRGWKAGAELALDYRWTGVGRGAFEAPAAAYRARDEGIRLVYPENLVVQILAEWGLLLGLGLIVLGARDGVRLGRRVHRMDASALAAGAGLIAVMTHELADFGLEMSGIAIPAAVTLGVVVARSDPRFEENRTKRLPRWAVAAALAAWGLFVVAGGWASAHTAQADGEASAALLRNQKVLLPSSVGAAIARHPADDFLELLAANQAVRFRHSSALGHLNRALRLHPASATAHRLAAQLLVESKHPQQAALEYRLALEHGLQMSDADLVKAVGSYAIDAVRQTPDSLISFARWLAQHGQAEQADLACLRALDLEPDSERVSRARVEVAMMGGNKSIIDEAARALVAAERIDPSSWVMAAEAFARADDFAAADQTLAKAMKAYPNEGSLTVTAAELKFRHGDITGARALLAHRGPAFTFEDRQRAEELLAQIAEQMNDPAAALEARTRAKMLAEQREGRR